MKHFSCRRVNSSTGLSPQRERGRLTMLWTLTLGTPYECPSQRLQRRHAHQNSPLSRTISSTLLDCLSYSTKRYMHTGIDNIIHIKFSVFHCVVEIYGYQCPLHSKIKLPLHLQQCQAKSNRGPNVHNLQNPTYFSGYIQF